MQVDDWHSLVPLNVAERFVTTPEGLFNHPSTTSCLTAQFSGSGAASEAPTAVTGTSRNASRTLHGCAAMLLGDAAHVFPPGVSHRHRAADIDVP